MVVLCIIMKHINDMCTTGVSGSSECVGGTRVSTGAGAAAGGAFFAYTFITYMHMLCASFLDSKEQALRAAAVQMRGINEPAGRACSSDGDFPRGGFAAGAAIAAEARRGALWRLRAELAPP